MCVTQDEGPEPSRHLYMTLAPDECSPCVPRGVTCSPMSEWTMPVKAGGEGVAAGGAASKALAIRNPKTGEVIARKALLGKTEQAKAALLSKDAKLKWQAAAKVLRQSRWCADHSTFSALNVDGLRRPNSELGASYQTPRDAARLARVQAKHGMGSMDPAKSKRGTNAWVASARAAMTLERNAAGMGPGEKIPRAAAATLAALSLEPGIGLRQMKQQKLQPLQEPEPAASEQKEEEAAASIGVVEPHLELLEDKPLEAKRPWKPKFLMNQKKEDDLVPEETATSAGDSQIQEASDTNSGEELCPPSSPEVAPLEAKELCPPSSPEAAPFEAAPQEASPKAETPPPSPAAAILGEFFQSPRHRGGKSRKKSSDASLPSPPL
eukprot:CAMPEP_0180503368 /NCGR_PEP_ID=MMETSP1036_2-20121128/46000_1 /TAXON_ID=632150 /ORGANISM="Azadinium spinosum, Strain 3D9" /LENGTH=379 /DNA_ID=CAMNT_0022512401 /DNA_START=170 /DNA_END=1305 /DNA_ORIENTATION=+